MNFSDWLINEEVGGSLFAKAVDREGLESILRHGFKTQGRQGTAAARFSREGGTTEEQMYGPGLYFYMVGSEDQARRSCKDYSGWGGMVVLARLKPAAKVLVTSWLPDSHPIWRHSSAGHAGVYDQLKGLGVLDMFPDYTNSSTHADPEWGYKLSGRIDGWVHQHNSRTHLVVYNPSAVEAAGHFECSAPNQSSAPAPSAAGPSKVDPKTGRQYDPSIPLDRQMRRTGLLLNAKDLQDVRRIQGDKSHPDHAFWSRFRVDSPPPAAPKPDGLSLEEV